MGSKSKKAKVEESWKQPSYRDLQRAALGKEADGIPDSELDAFAASVIVRESQTKTAAQNRKASGSSTYFFVDEPKPISTTATNKVFLANTIKNTSSYNNAMKRIEEKELHAKKMAEEERVRKSSRKPAKSIRTKDNPYLAAFNDDEEPDNGQRRIARLMGQAKLKFKRKTVISLDQAVKGTDPGPYGPKVKSLGAGEPPIRENQPNTRLPSKCPW